MKLSDFELEVMQFFWKEGEAIVPDLHAAIAADRRVSYSTVKTIVDRLEEKGAVKRIRTYGRTILYGPAVTRDKVTRPLVKDFVHRLFNGRVRPMISQVLADEELSLDDLAYLEALIAKKKQQKSEGDV
ncbi:MAG: BlaI/MecI/CopY family transcriptional regulator [Acidobacteriota bacterium]|nr:BlaI/MecI/CopY family transcriptional regulator [Acidobacteriota bacterium]